MRALTILRHILPLGLSFLRDRHRWVFAGRPAARSVLFHQARAERLVATIAALGPTFVKLAQVFSARADLIPEPYIGRLSSLTDQVPAVPTPLIEREIERAYGQPVRAVFERFDETPLAAASLGQVHRARYGGEDVVVKVLRPDVEDLVRRDLALALPVVRWLERRMPNPHLRNTRAVIEEFATRIPEEMDFVHEAANARVVRANFAGNRQVVIPRVIDELVRPRVLVLEYVEGVRVDRLTSRPGERLEDPRGIVTAVLELYLRMMLVHGFFHADPHPGNVLVTPDGRIVVLDFGMVVPVSKALRSRLVTTVYAAIRRDTEGLLAGLESLGVIDPGADRESVHGLADRLLTLAYVEMPMRDRVAIVTNEVMAALYDWPVRLPSELVYFARTAALIEGLGVRYDGSFNAITFASPIAIRMRREIMTSLGHDVVAEADLPTVVGAALGHVAGTAVRTGRQLLDRLGAWLSYSPQSAGHRPESTGRRPPADGSPETENGRQETSETMNTPEVRNSRVIAVITSRLAITMAFMAATALPAQTLTGARVRLGVEVLLTDSVHLVRGKRVGLITNHTGTTPDGRSTIDVLHRLPGVRLTALFAPEHGIRGQAQAGERISSGIDSATGVPVHSLYGDTRVPTPAMLQDVDVLLYDIQDVGARVYTYVWTMALSAEAAHAAGKPFVVLDRPNPVRADRVEGGVLDPAFRSFVGQYPVAMRYGLTPGELLRYLVGTGQVRADIAVVPMSGYRRDMWWDATGLPWRNPSPNIRSADAALLYTGTVLFEGTNLSEGRGTSLPFQLIGAGWLHDAGAIARELNAKRIPGVVFDSTLVTVEAGQKWGGRQIPMIAVVVADRNAVVPQRVGLEMLRAIYRRHPGEFQWRTGAIDRLSGSDRVRTAVELDGIDTLMAILDREAGAFQERVRPYRIYP